MIIITTTGEHHWENKSKNFFYSPDQVLRIPAIHEAKFHQSVRSCCLPRTSLTHLCPGEDYWADFYNFLHMNPSDDQMKNNILVGINGLKRLLIHNV